MNTILLKYGLLGFLFFYGGCNIIVGGFRVEKSHKSNYDTFELVYGLLLIFFVILVFVT